MFNKKTREKRKMYKEKIKELRRYEILEEYLKERIQEGETQRRNELSDVQKIIDELRKLLDFLKK